MDGVKGSRIDISPEAGQTSNQEQDEDHLYSWGVSVSLKFCFLVGFMEFWEISWRFQGVLMDFDGVAEGSGGSTQVGGL